MKGKSIFGTMQETNPDTRVFSVLSFETGNLLPLLVLPLISLLTIQVRSVDCDGYGIIFRQFTLRGWQRFNLNSPN